MKATRKNGLWSDAKAAATKLRSKLKAKMPGERWNHMKPEQRRRLALKARFEPAIARMYASRSWEKLPAGLRSAIRQHLLMGVVNPRGSRRSSVVGRRQKQNPAHKHQWKNGRCALCEAHECDWTTKGKRCQKAVARDSRYCATHKSMERQGIKPNPAGRLNAAQAKYEEFHGKPSTEVIEVLEAEGVSAEVVAKIAAMVPPDDYTGLGDLSELQILTPKGEPVSIAFSGKERPRLCCNPDGTQLYFVGGNQDVGELVKRGASLGFALVDLGECFQVEYVTRKKFDGFQLVNYYHEFGEETGERPRLLWSAAHRKLYLVGGAYSIRPEGIVN